MYKSGMATAGNFVPQHIHINIRAKGFKDRNLQLVFEDDPVMDDHWLQWAKDLLYPAAKMVYSDGKPYGVVNLEIKRN